MSPGNGHLLLSKVLALGSVLGLVPRPSPFFVRSHLSTHQRQFALGLDSAFVPHHPFKVGSSKSFIGQARGPYFSQCCEKRGFWAGRRVEVVCTPSSNPVATGDNPLPLLLVVIRNLAGVRGSYGRDGQCGGCIARAGRPSTVLCSREPGLRPGGMPPGRVRHFAIEDDSQNVLNGHRSVLRVMWPEVPGFYPPVRLGAVQTHLNRHQGNNETTRNPSDRIVGAPCLCRRMAGLGGERTQKWSRHQHPVRIVGTRDSGGSEVRTEGSQSHRRCSTAVQARATSRARARNLRAQPVRNSGQRGRAPVRTVTSKYALTNWAATASMRRLSPFLVFYKQLQRRGQMRSPKKQRLCSSICRHSLKAGALSASRS